MRPGRSNLPVPRAWLPHSFNEKMAAFLARSDLSRGDLRLFLRNGNGYPQDAFDVRWTVLHADGRRASGKSLPATKADVGEYYAPWCVSSKNGCYKVVWEYQEESGFPVLTKEENLFVVNISSYGRGIPLTQDSIPEPGCQTFLTGDLLGQGDLPLFLKDPDGFPTDAFGVFWTIYNAVGAPVTQKAVAARVATGEYYAPWHIRANSGDYTIKWEWLEAVDTPFESKSQRFSIINPPTPYAPLAPFRCLSAGYDPICDGVILAPRALTSTCVPCGPQSCAAPAAACATTTAVIIPTVSATDQCCSFEIPRTVHRATGLLPASGSFTDQTRYKIPDAIRNITFYMTYTRGADGGYPIYQLLWSNGVEETQETMIDMDFTILSPSSVSQDMFLQNLSGPVPDSNNPMNSIFRVCVPGGATSVRLIAAEKGIIGTPGILGITLTAAG